MGETLMQQRRVREEVFRFVNLFHQGGRKGVYGRNTPGLHARHPAEIQGGSTLSGFFGCKVGVDVEA